MTDKDNPFFSGGSGGSTPGDGDSGALMSDEHMHVLESMGVQLIPLPEFQELSAIIYDHFGIKVTRKKLILVTSRIHPILLERGFNTHREYIDALKKDASGELLSELANHISTNHTSFYREEDHFAVLMNKALPAIVARKTAAGNHDLRVWCAACSTGEEAYTLQFCLMRFFGKDYGKWKAGVLGTDISMNALAKAKRGIYPVSRLESVPLDVQREFFYKVGPDACEVVPAVKKEMTFRRLNLTNKNYPLKKAFDIIFCRNVMIYFDQALRRELVDRLYEWLTPEGYLFIGHSESVPNIEKKYAYVSPSVYMRRKG